MRTDERYCAVPSTVWPCSSGFARVHFAHTRDLRVTPVKHWELLRHRTFEYLRTLDEHIDLLGSDAGHGAPTGGRGASTHWFWRTKLNGGGSGDVARLLQNAVALNLLMSEAQLVSVLAAAEPRSKPPSMQSVRITTLNQEAALAACLVSLSANANRYGRRVEYVVLDDARSNDNAKRAIDLVRGRIMPCGVAYVSHHHLRDYCQRLASEAAVDPRTVFFALMPDETLRRTDGGNKNALMLDGVDERYLQVDDDIQCLTSVPQDSSLALRLYVGREPMDNRYFRSQDDLRNAVSWGDVDLIGAHEEILGYGASQWVNPSKAIRFAGPTAKLLPYLLNSDTPTVRATFTGLTGDPATEFPSYRTLLEEPSRSWLVASRSEYGGLRLSRQVLRTAPQVTITRPTGTMPYAMGCDATELLPPFFPLGRCYEKVFTILLSRCWHNAMVAFLPVTVRHAPTSPRAYGDDALVKGATALRLPDVFGLLISSATLPTVGSAATRLERVGQYLIDVATLSNADLRNFMDTAVFAYKVKQLDRYHRALIEHSRRPAWWADDVLAQIQALEQSLERLESASLCDYPQFSWNCADGIEPLRSIMTAFGKVLTAWPTLFGAARRLSAKGSSLRDIAQSDS